MSEWISVKDRMPGDGVYVLTFGGFDSTQIAAFSNGLWWDDTGYKAGNVTHWMPLPDAPEEVESQ